MNSLRTARFVDREDNLINSGDLNQSGLFVLSPYAERKKRSPERKSQEVKILEDKIKKLEEDLEKCKMKLKDLKYRPGGPGYEKAKQRFEMGVAKQKASKPKPKKSSKRKSPRKSLRKAKSM